MNNNNPPPNNNRAPRPRPPLQQPSLNPEERKIWLASHNAPKDMLMFSTGEFVKIQQTLVRQQLRISALMLLLQAAEPRLAKVHAFFADGLKASELEGQPEEPEDRKVFDDVKARLADLEAVLGLVRAQINPAPAAPKPEGPPHG